MPAGREMASDAAADGPASAVTGFTFDDVKPQREVDFTNAARVTTKTFDGLTVTADVAHKGTDYWAQLDAMSQSGKPDIGQAGARHQRRASMAGRIKLADYKGAQFMTPLESLLKPPAGARRACSRAAPRHSRQSSARALGPDPMSDDLYLRDLWYMAGLARPLLRGDMQRVMLLGEPVLIGRMRDGEAFALRDICPHRGVPLSAGRVTPEGTVECPYHGWRFKADGQCSLIPSLVGGEPIKPESIRVRAYPVREQDGLIWVYMAAPGRESIAARERAAARPGRRRQPSALEREPDLPLRDRSRCDRTDGPRARALRARPLVVARHAARQGEALRPAPERLRDDAPRAEQDGLQAAGRRRLDRDHLRAALASASRTSPARLLGRRIAVTGSPPARRSTRETTQVTQIFYWPAWLGFIKPFFRAMGPTFLGDDRRMVELQREGLKFDPRLMLIQDADVPAMWYHRLKKAWSESTATGAPFVNPLKETTLRWKS